MTDIGEERIRQDEDDEHDSDDTAGESSDEEDLEPRVVHSASAFPLRRRYDQRLVKAVRSRVKDGCCMWRLYATPTKTGSTWKIKKRPSTHTCRDPDDRFDHVEMSAAMIAIVIREDSKDDLGLSIKNI